jgi:hypothetical protein
MPARERAPPRLVERQSQTAPLAPARVVPMAKAAREALSLGDTAEGERQFAAVSALVEQARQTGGEAA